MNDKELLALMYDFYNEHTLKMQNDDINYYKTIIKNYNAKNVLIVGAGTGRVAIPLSDITNIEALDLDLDRLNIINKKNKNIKTIYANFLDFFKEKEYDLIIFPYSTIQFKKGKTNITKMIKKAYEVSNKNTLVLLDFSSSFNTKPEVNKELLFEDYCDEVNDNVKVYYSSIQHSNYIEFIVEYNINNKKHSVYEHEFYYHYDKKSIKKAIVKTGFNILKINNGYGNNGFNHKHVYFLKKDDLDER